MKAPARFLLPAFALAASVTFAADAPVEIKPRWQVGKKYSQGLEMQQESVVTFGAQKMNQKMSTVFDTETTVTPHADAGKKRLNVVYKRMAINMDMNGQKMGYDSAKPDGPDPLGFGKSIGGLVGKEMKMVLNENDQVEVIENFDEIIGGALGGNPAGAQMTAGFLNKETMQNMVRQSVLYSTPGKPVKAGDSWPFDMSVPLPQIGNVTMKGTYTVKGMVERNGAKCAELALDGKMDMDLSAPAAPTAGGDASAANPQAEMLKQLGMKVEGGLLKGTVWFDPALGMNREAHFKQEMTMTMKNPAKPDEAITVPIHQTITQTLKSVEDVK